MQTTTLLDQLNIQVDKCVDKLRKVPGAYLESAVALDEENDLSIYLDSDTDGKARLMVQIGTDPAKSWKECKVLDKALACHLIPRLFELCYSLEPEVQGLILDAIQQTHEQLKKYG